MNIEVEQVIESWYKQIYKPKSGRRKRKNIQLQRTKIKLHISFRRWWIQLEKEQIGISKYRYSIYPFFYRLLFLSISIL